MTTIAYRDGTLAADARVCIGEWIAGESAQKLYRLKDGRAAGITGELLKGVRFIKWLQGHRVARPDLGDSTRVIVLNHNNSLTIYEGVGEYDSSPEFAAWGSGIPAALAALYCGKTAAEAVEIAARIDPWTGGGIVVMKCEQPEIPAGAPRASMRNSPRRVSRNPAKRPG